MLAFLNLFDTSGFPPRWQCGEWSSAHGWLHILSDLGVWSAYIAIPCVLAYFVLRRKDIPFRMIFVLFAAFIVACGTTHLMEAIIFWWPAYRLAGAIKLFTAIVSWATVFALIRVVPKVLAMRSPEELEREIKARKLAEEELRRVNADLERRVEARTSELRETAAKFRVLFDQSSIFAGIMTLDGKMIEANRLSLDTCGYTSEEVLGKPFWECGWWRGSETVQAKMRVGTQQAAQGTPYKEVLPYHWADGTERVVEFGLYPIRDDKGQIIFLHPTGIDITERIRTERALHDTSDALKQANQRKDEFLATLAHELRNPMAPIRNSLHLLHKAGRDVVVMEKARSIMERQFTHLVRLVDDLMDISRISRGKLELVKAPIAVTDVLDNAVETSRPLMEEMGHTLELVLPKDPVLVDADMVRLSQVFMNLLINAAKYSDRNGRITLAVECQGTDVLISVIDQGIGIVPGQLPRIFEIFTQLDGSMQRSRGGLGIGLSLVKQLVDLHGGRIEAQSDGIGKGSRFIVRLPILLKLPARTPVRRNGSGNTKATTKILIADDNEDVANTLAMMLKLEGHEIRTVNDGEQAVAVWQAFQPDVVLLDIGMPKLNGYETCRRIRELPGGKNVVIIAQTGWGQEGDRQNTQEAGFDKHLVKPVDPSTLIEFLAGLSESAKK